MIYFSDSDVSVSATVDAGLYNCSFTLGTEHGRKTFTESIHVSGTFLLILCVKTC